LENALFKRDAGTLSDMKSLNHSWCMEMASLEKGVQIYMFERRDR
jgi:hypothetical protein